MRRIAQSLTEVEGEHHSFRLQLLLRTGRVASSFVFFTAAIAKLISLPITVTIFGLLGTGQWFRYLTGLIEFSGALLLLTSRFVGVGGLLLALTMVGAVISHLTVAPSPLAPAAALLALNLVIAWNYRFRTMVIYRNLVVSPHTEISDDQVDRDAYKTHVAPRVRVDSKRDRR